ncbi:MCE family protein [Mycolicibacterium sp. A43C]
MTINPVRRAAAVVAAFVAICLTAAFGLMAIFGQVRFDDLQKYRAEFTDVSGLEEDNFVRIAGVEVGKVEKIWIDENARSVVEFAIDPTVVLTEGTKMAVRWANPIGDRYLELSEGTGSTRTLAAGSTIGVAMTEPALDLDTLLGGFRPLFRAMDPDQVNALSTQLIEAFQGNGAAIGAFLSQAASATSALADRDELIGQVITNLNTVLMTMGQRSDQVATAVDSLSVLMAGLAERRTDISLAVGSTDRAAASIADLLTQVREPLKNAVVQSDRASGIVVADHDYVDDLIKTLPDAYRTLGRLGTSGNFVPEYLCAMFLKLNGKGGQPVYVKVAGQDTGRCAPR